MTNSTNIQIINNEAVVSSLDIAAAFDKEHKDVLKAIRNIIKEIAEINQLNFEAANKNNNLTNGRNFALVDYKDAKGESRPCYLLNRDAFSLIAMGFTGRKALEWKLKYIAAFNAMEAKLKSSPVAEQPTLKAMHIDLPEKAVNGYKIPAQIPLIKELFHFLKCRATESDTIGIDALLLTLRAVVIHNIPLKNTLYLDNQNRLNCH